MHALCLPFNCGEALVLGRRIRDWGRLVLEAHARSHLAEEARRFDGRLRVHKDSLAAEHVLIQRERGGPQHAQKVGEVQRWVGVQIVLSRRITNGLVGNSPKRSERGTHLVPIAAIVNIKMEFLASPMPRASATRSARHALRSSKNRRAGAQTSWPLSPWAAGSEWSSRATALSAGTWRQGRGRRERARRMPREERRKSRWPCSDVGRRLKTQTPRRPSFVKYLAQKGEASAKKGKEWGRTRRPVLGCGVRWTVAELYTNELKVCTGE